MQRNEEPVVLAAAAITPLLFRCWINRTESRHEYANHFFHSIALYTVEVDCCCARFTVVGRVLQIRR